MKNLKRGFVTVATGKYYYWLAQNLVTSYRLFSDDGIPFYLITDKEGKEYFSKGWCKKLFDGFVVLEKPNYSYMDKMMVYYNTPFEETIFLDADAHIIDNISFLFDKFEQNGSEVSLNGSYRSLSIMMSNHFSTKTIERFGFTRYIAFNGGMYYYKKSPAADQMMKYIFDVLIPNYDEYGLTRFLGKIADEPLFSVSMMVHGMDPIDDEVTERGYMYCPYPINGYEWNMDTRKCTLYRYGERFSPLIVHYGTHNTYSLEYVLCTADLKTKYKHNGAISKRLNRISAMITYGYRLAKHDYYRTLFWPWVKGHFTKNWLKLQIQRVTGKNK